MIERDGEYVDAIGLLSLHEGIHRVSQRQLPDPDFDDDFQDADAAHQQSVSRVTDHCCCGRREFRPIAIYPKVCMGVEKNDHIAPPHSSSVTGVSQSSPLTKFPCPSPRIP